MNATTRLHTLTSSRIAALILNKNVSFLRQLYSEFKEDLWQHKRTTNVVLLIAYVVILVLGVVGNIAALTVIVTNSRLRCRSSFFLINLLVSDLLG